MRRYFLILLLFGNFINSYSQANFINGNIGRFNNREVRLVGFCVTKDTVLSKCMSDGNGKFVLSYPKSYSGAALVQIKEGPSIIALLNNEDFSINWNNTSDSNDLQFINSKENQLFVEGCKTNLKSQQKLKGLNYLLTLYENEGTDIDVVEILSNQKELQLKLLPLYIENLPSNSYAREYLRQRKVINDLQNATLDVKFSEELNIIFSHTNLEHFSWKNSGLLREVLDLLLKNILYISNEESRISTYNKISLKIINEFKQDSILFNLVSEYLLKFYEKYALSSEAEFLALKILGDNLCIVDSNKTPIFEQYRKMKIGNVAPELVFDNSNAKFNKLSDIRTKYKVVVFGASWCEECKKEIPQLKEYAELFNTSYDAKIIFVSIDTDQNSFSSFTKDLPFVTSCDFEGWEGQNVTSYYVFATPTIYIVDQNSKIVAKIYTAIDAAKWLYDNTKR